MFKCLVKYIFVLFICVYSSAVFADEETALTILVVDNPPFSYLNDKGEIEGETVTQIINILSKTDLDYKFNLVPWPRPLRLVQENLFTLHYSMGRNKQREKLFTWVIPIRTKITSIIARNEREFNSLPNDPKLIVQENKSYRYGCLADSIQCQMLIDLGVSKSQITTLNGEPFSKLAQLLDRKRIDFFIGENNLLPNFLELYNLALDRLIPIAVIGKIQRSYLTGNLNLDPEIIKIIRQAAKEVDAKKVQK